MSNVEQRKAMNGLSFIKMKDSEHVYALQMKIHLRDGKTREFIVLILQVTEK